MADGNLFINGAQHFDGAPTLVNGVTPASIVCEGVTVWLNNYPPGPPTGFVAADGTSGVTCTWVNPVDDGVPDATYDVYEDNILVGTNVTSPWVRTVSPGTRTYFARATNIAGHADSNTDSGTSVQPSGTMTFTSSQPWIVPDGVYSVNVCMIGGGGSGATDKEAVPVGGGYAGESYSGTYGVTPEATITVTIGAGGGAVDHNTQEQGNPGNPTSFGTLSVAGGGGGTTPGGTYAGNSGTQTGCWGTSTDGSGVYQPGSYDGRGGQGGFGNGGFAAAFETIAGTGGVGAGGGGSANAQYPGVSGAGGRGEVRLTW